MANQDFEFIDPGPLVDGELEVVVVTTTPGDPSRNWLPVYIFEMRVGGLRAGGLNLRVGNTEDIVTYCGNIGYSVQPEHRGNHYAERACRLILPLIRAHGFRTIWIGCDPQNVPSRRTCERLGAEMIEIVSVPENHNMYERGHKEVCRYRLEL